MMIYINPPCTECYSGDLADHINPVARNNRSPAQSFPEAALIGPFFATLSTCLVASPRVAQPHSTCSPAASRRWPLFAPYVHRSYSRRCRWGCGSTRPPLDYCICRTWSPLWSPRERPASIWTCTETISIQETMTDVTICQKTVPIWVDCYSYESWVYLHIKGWLYFHAKRHTNQRRLQ